MNLRLWKIALGFLLFCLCPSLQAKNLALKNFRELYTSYSTLLNIKPDDATEKEFSKNYQSLPKTGKPSDFSAAMELSVLRVASAFCWQRINLDKDLAPEKRWFLRDIDFKSDPRNLAPAALVSALNDLANTFWQREVTPEEFKILESGAKALAAADTSHKMEVYMTLLCTLYGMSTDFITL